MNVVECRAITFQIQNQNDDVYESGVCFLPARSAGALLRMSKKKQTADMTDRHDHPKSKGGT